MTPYRNNLKTPEEVELGKKRDELGRFQEELANWQHTYSSLRSEIRLFEHRYERILGARISELEDLEWQLKGMLGSDDFNRDAEYCAYEEGFVPFHNLTDLLDDEGLSDDLAQKNLKGLYREVAKAVHPDLASDENDRLRRQELMSIANQAYESGDRGGLENILSEWEHAPEPVSEVDVALELVRVIRLIARVQQNIHAVICQLEELKSSDIYSFKLRVDDSESDGINLMEEMATRVDLDIVKTKRRLSILRGDSGSEEIHDGHPMETRFIRFPKDKNCGMLFERNRVSVDYRDWQRLGRASGVREVFMDKAVRLDVQGNGDTDIGFLDDLKSDDLQALFLYEIDDNALLHLNHLSGLEELYLSNTRVSDQGLSRLNGLARLQRLYIYHTAISDAGLQNLSALKQLKWLTCSGTGITEDGLNSFRLALPGCKAVSFKWRHGK